MCEFHMQKDLYLMHILENSLENEVLSHVRYFGHNFWFKLWIKAKLVRLEKRFSSLQICISRRNVNSDDFMVKNRRQSRTNLGQDCWKFRDILASFTFSL